MPLNLVVICGNVATGKSLLIDSIKHYFALPRRRLLIKVLVSISIMLMTILATSVAAFHSFLKRPTVLMSCLLVSVSVFLVGSIYVVKCSMQIFFHYRHHKQHFTFITRPKENDWSRGAIDWSRDESRGENDWSRDAIDERVIQNDYAICEIEERHTTLFHALSKHLEYYLEWTNTLCELNRSKQKHLVVIEGSPLETLYVLIESCRSQLTRGEYKRLRTLCQQHFDPIWNKRAVESDVQRQHKQDKGNTEKRSRDNNNNNNNNNNNTNTNNPSYNTFNNPSYNTFNSENNPLNIYQNNDDDDDDDDNDLNTCNYDDLNAYDGDDDDSLNAHDLNVHDLNVHDLNAHDLNAHNRGDRDDHNRDLNVNLNVNSNIWKNAHYIYLRHGNVERLASRSTISLERLQTFSTLYERLFQTTNSNTVEIDCNNAEVHSNNVEVHPNNTNRIVLEEEEEEEEEEEANHLDNASTTHNRLDNLFTVVDVTDLHQNQVFDRVCDRISTL